MLLLLTAMPASRVLRHKFFLRRRFVLLEIPANFFESHKAKDLLENLPVPFVFEVAVHHLGKDKHFYLSVPKTHVAQVIAQTGAEEADDYNIYHSGGSHLGFYLKSVNLISLDLASIDFSRINVVGEGAVIQLIVKYGGQSRASANFRILVSAPTPYQAQEVALGLNSSMSDSRPVTVSKNLQVFIHRLTYREFDEEEAVGWSNA
ncbi:MAG: hypothetical protein A3D47_00830 [Candidatus Colwellbacteria bacterium RIFCSPHIGHO2_02_FULL_43_15]|nr:MAG: hypothetical protein A3D47_00830 [Candidatus Colwellbacteria bacterium RIFCSPHIGHO2_02_FULL_43_15]